MFIANVQILLHFTDSALLILNTSETKEDHGTRKSKATSTDKPLSALIKQDSAIPQANIWGL